MKNVKSIIVDERSTFFDDKYRLTLQHEMECIPQFQYISILQYILLNFRYIWYEMVYNLVSEI